MENICFKCHSQTNTQKCTKCTTAADDLTTSSRFDSKPNRGNVVGPAAEPQQPQSVVLDGVQKLDSLFIYLVNYFS